MAEESWTTLRARVAAHSMHAAHDSKVVSQPARNASPGADGYWEQRVDPDNVLDPSERARRAGHAKKAYFTKLALASAKARRKAGTP